MAIAFEWAATAMTISAEMVVPGLLGYVLDQYLGTRVLFLFVGFAIGALLATLSLMRIARKGAGSPGGAGQGHSGTQGRSGAGSNEKRSTPDAEG